MHVVVRRGGLRSVGADPFRSAVSGACRYLKHARVGTPGRSAMALSTTEPRAIRRLAEDVVNRVAAGEVIHRPASALKEILENSLDAGATSVVVTVKDGGNKLLQVQDDGHGIREADMPILCERHTTSKLQTFEDLDTVSTFGFRGEALASVSFVSNLTVTTMTADASHAVKAAYRDGRLEDGDPRPCAGVPGTTITVENLFYNVPARRRALKSPSEEFARVLEVIQRYAALRVDVSFACRKLGDARPALHCPVTPDRVERIRAIYGANVARQLARVNLRVGGEVGGEEGGEGGPRDSRRASAVVVGSGRASMRRGDADFHSRVPLQTHDVRVVHQRSSGGVRAAQTRRRGDVRRRASQVGASLRVRGVAAPSGDGGRQRASHQTRGALLATGRYRGGHQGGDRGETFGVERHANVRRGTRGRRSRRGPRRTRTPPAAESTDDDADVIARCATSRRGRRGGRRERKSGEKAKDHGAR